MNGLGRVKVVVAPALHNRERICTRGWGWRCAGLWIGEGGNYGALTYGFGGAMRQSVSLLFFSFSFFFFSPPRLERLRGHLKVQ